MFGNVLSALGIDGLILFLVIGAIVILIFIVITFFWMSEGLGTVLNGIDKKTHEQSVYESIPKLREIADLFPKEKVGIEARKFLEKWDNEIEPGLERLDHAKRRKKLRAFYQSNIRLILEAYEQMTKS